MTEHRGGLCRLPRILYRYENLAQCKSAALCTLEPCFSYPRVTDLLFSLWSRQPDGLTITSQTWQLIAMMLYWKWCTVYCCSVTITTPSVAAVIKCFIILRSHEMRKFLPHIHSHLKIWTARRMKTSSLNVWFHTSYYCVVTLEYKWILGLQGQSILFAVLHLYRNTLVPPSLHCPTWVTTIVGLTRYTVKVGCLVHWVRP